MSRLTGRLNLSPPLSVGVDFTYKGANSFDALALFTSLNSAVNSGIAVDVPAAVTAATTALAAAGPLHDSTTDIQAILDALSPVTAEVAALQSGTLNAKNSAGSGDLTISYDPTRIHTKTQLQAGLRKFLDIISSGLGGLGT